jgi:hypothetical protein
MKYLLFTATLLLACTANLSAQCVVVGDKTTGVFGVGYNNDGVATSFNECRDYAAKECTVKGGSDCVPLYEGAEQGWWAAISGVNGTGEVLIALVAGKESEYDAEMSVRKQYGGKGGLNADNVAAYGWFVRSNVK